MDPVRRNFRYLNREGRWLDFQSSGLDLGDDGAFRLRASPRLLQAAPLLPDGSPPLTAPAGVAVDARGRIFYSEPSANSLWVRDDCDGEWSRILCTTEAHGLGKLSVPRGLLVLERSRRLVVVESDHARLLFLDLETFALRECWGVHGFYGKTAGTKLREPWSVAADADENLYVLEHGAGRVSKFRRTGEREAAFAEGIAQHGVSAATAIAVGQRSEGALVFVADAPSRQILVFESGGQPLLDARGVAVAIRFEGMGNVFALAANRDTLFVADDAGQRLLSFRLTPGFPFAGDAVGFARGACALACDGQGSLVALPASGPPLELETATAFVRAGVLWSGAIAAGGAAVTWQRLRASLTGAPSAHIEFYFAVSNQAVAPPVAVASDAPFADPLWRALPKDVSAFLLDAGASVPTGSTTGLYFFVGARLTGDRTASVALSQLRVDFDVEGYERYLPKIYREPALDGVFVRRYLALFQSLFEELEDETEDLAKYLEPAAAPAEALPWLATWVAASIDEGDPVASIRASIAHAFERQRWRGTAEGLRLALLEDAGVHATISEPIRAAALWGFPAQTACAGASPVQPPALGGGTYLPASEAGGAVLGTNAVLDRSYLITDAQFGEPPFEELAYQFVVEVAHAEAGSPERLKRVRAVIEREKPAHTSYRLELIEPGLRVGHQARVGVDTLVSGAPAPSALGEAIDLRGVRLGGSEPLRVGRLRLGEEIRL